MELYQGKRYWPTITKKVEFGHLSGNYDVDYVVIGGGMSGLLSAFHLAKAGYQVLLLEQNRIGHGSSSLNTGLIQYMSDKTLTELSKDFSKELAVSFYKASKEALDRIERTARELPEEVAFQRIHSFYVTDKEEEMTLIEKEAKAQVDAGFDVEYLTAQEAAGYGLKVAAALLTKRDVELNPMAFVVAMAEKAQADYGLKISEETKVAEEDIDFARNVINTQDLAIHFNHLIVATGYEFYDLAKKVMPQAQLISTFATITKKLPEIPAKGYMFWENSDAYGYFRKSPDDRLIIGGADEKDQELSLEKAQRKARELCKDIEGYLEGAFHLLPEFYYEAIFGESDDGLPYIGPHPDYPQVFLVHGVGGNGTVYSSIAAGEVLKWANKDKNLLNYLWPGTSRRLSERNSFD